VPASKNAIARAACAHTCQPSKKGLQSGLSIRQRSQGLGSKNRHSHPLQFHIHLQACIQKVRFRCLEDAPLFYNLLKQKSRSNETSAAHTMHHLSTLCPLVVYFSQGSISIANHAYPPPAALSDTCPKQKQLQFTLSLAIVKRTEGSVQLRNKDTHLANARTYRSTHSVEVFLGCVLPAKEHRPTKRSSQEVIRVP
jgi:hypothetical protein